MLLSMHVAADATAEGRRSDVDRILGADFEIVECRSTVIGESHKGSIPGLAFRLRRQHHG